MNLVKTLVAVILAWSVALVSANAGQKVTIAAAADLKFAMDEIADAFRNAHPGDEVDIIYGSSGKFNTQIQQGAPFDVFFSADKGYAEQLKKQGLAVTEPRLYAVGRIVLWSPTRDASKMALKDLDDPKLNKIAVANPAHAPYGKRAEEALRAVGLWDKLKDKLVFGENVAQTAQFVQAGAADIGVIALSLAKSPELSSKGGYALIPDKLHSSLEQAFVITKVGEANPLAKAYASFMNTKESRQIMVRYGFVLPTDTAMK